MTLPSCALVNIRQIVGLRRHPNMGRLILVGGPPLLEKLIEVLQNNFGIPIISERAFLASTLEEAYAVLGYGASAQQH